MRGNIARREEKGRGSDINVKSVAWGGDATPCIAHQRKGKKKGKKIGSTVM